MNQKVEFKNDEVGEEQYNALLQEIYLIEKFIAKPQHLSGSLPF